MKYIKLLTLSVVALMMASCSDSEKGSNEPEMSDKEQALQNAVCDYVEYTVRPVYGAMADAAVELRTLCHDMQSKRESGALSRADVEKAGNAWKAARKNWELSEAFLYGPAANHNIDPHIDSWPLDKAAMENLLSQIRNGNSWTLENNGGYGLIGFHAIEYMLFELTADGNASQVHSLNYTPEEMEYLVAVADDLCLQCVCLEACWAGIENISEEKRTLLKDEGLNYGENYGREMINAGSAGSRFKTYQEAAEEIVQGCIDIADEVGNTKIGRPHLGSSQEDKNYIESPYSLNSIEDFADNIRSIRNSYEGASGSSHSVSEYIKSKNPEIDTRVRAAIDEAIKAIEAIPEPFAKHATGSLSEAAMQASGARLVSALEEAMGILTGR
ncbi:MAG: hypothetical protein K2G67_01305 [Muribaculaceae bacterium]|nr:hypothetical protein [Muribaculaceae bacterium]